MTTDDPYNVLEIPYWASEEQIKQAFLKKIKDEKNTPEIVNAYGKIRDFKSRVNLLLCEVYTCMASPCNDNEMSKIDVEALIKELAFRTEWELGAETCLKK